MSNDAKPETHQAPPDPLASPDNRAILAAIDRRLAALVYPETTSNICGPNGAETPWFWAPELFERRHQTALLMVEASRRASPTDAAYLVKTANRLNRCTESVVIIRRKRTPECAALVPPCNNRLCPVCQIRMSRARAEALTEAVTPAACSGHLTSAVLTVPNCKEENLKERCHEIKTAFRILRGAQGGKSKAPPPWDQVLGGAWNLEVTYNPNSNTYHPHVHVLIHAPFIPGRAARDAWRAACGRAGIFAKTWRVHLSQVKADPENLGGAIAEVSKYITKPFGKSDIRASVRTIVCEMQGIRCHDSWGTLHYSTARKHHVTDWEMLGGLVSLLKNDTPTSNAEIKEAVLKCPTARAIAARRYGLLGLIPYGSLDVENQPGEPAGAPKKDTHEQGELPCL